MIVVHRVTGSRILSYLLVAVVLIREINGGSYYRRVQSHNSHLGPETGRSEKEDATKVIQIVKIFKPTADIIEDFSDLGEPF
jgi:hypothetical protein